MTQSPDNDGLGPLPKSDRNAELQRLSFKALEALLKNQDGILFRDEPKQDYGADGSFEIKVADGVSNLRSPIQLKAVESISPNTDGTISHSVETYNLNYLLNGPCPIYLLYNAAEDSFWYVWAHDEAKRLAIENPTWKEQGTITLHFSKQLRPSGLEAIRERTMSEGRFLRRIKDGLARSTLGSPVVVSINSETLQVTDSGSANSILLASGPAIVGSGYAQEALTLSGLLSPAMKSHPRIQLVLAYANFTLGNFHETRGQIGKALTRDKEMEPHDVLFLHGLRDAVELRIGAIDRATYSSRLAQRLQAQPAGPEAIIARIEDLRFRLLKEHNRSKRSQIHNELRAVVKSLNADSAVSAAVKLSARITLLHVEGTEGCMEAFHQGGIAEMRRNLGVTFSPEIAAEVSAANRSVFEWGNAANDAVKDAADLKHPILIGDALTTWLGVRLFQLVNKRFQSMLTGQPFVLPQNVLDALKDKTRQAMEIYEHAGCLDGELRVKMLLADLLEVAGDTSEAKRLAAEVQSAARAMDYHDLVERAADLLGDRTTLMEAEAELKAQRSIDRDVEFAHSSDDSVRTFARDSLAAAGIPLERLAVVERDCFAMRLAAQQRVQWCRHLNLLQDLRHLNDASTAYKTDPNRKCTCKHFGYLTQVPSTDATTVIAAFKGAYCADCAHRSPKQHAAAPGI